MNTRIARYLMMGAAAMGLAGAPLLSAQDWGRYDIHPDHSYVRGDIRNDRRDIAHDYSRLSRMKADIRRDQARAQDDREDGRYRKLGADRADLARDYAERNAQRRDIHRDTRDVRRDQRELWRDRY